MSETQKEIIMKFISQTVRILLFTLAGEVLHAVIPFPIPPAIYGIALLFIALSTGLVKEEQVADVSGFLISLIPLLFVAPVAKVLQYWGVIAPKLIAICIITIVSTLVVFSVSGLVTKRCQKRKEHKNDG